MRAILIIAYRRAGALTEILDSCKDSKIRDIFIHIDGPKDSSAKENVDEVIQIAKNFADKANFNVRIAIQDRNLGCATSLITACDQAVLYADELILLEDDCVPGRAFWDFAEQSFECMKMDDSIALFCGPQFAPEAIHSSEWLLSSYPFHWGWGITAANWNKIREQLLSASKIKQTAEFTRYECRYWNAGSNRALRGVTDVWDTLFVREMIRIGLRALLPPENLIRNSGNDDLALHTSVDSAWTNFEVGSFKIQKGMPCFNPRFDMWARTDYFKISRRHLISTRLTALFDRFKSRRFQNSLEERVESASFNFI